MLNVNVYRGEVAATARLENSFNITLNKKFIKNYYKI
jgi:hypothetical protein